MAASRLESSGTGNQIHISETTASLLVKEGKSDWIQEREDSVYLKGKGNLKTYWLLNNKGDVVTSEEGELSSSALRTPRRRGPPSSSSDSKEGRDQPILDNKTSRVVEWNVDVLVTIIKQIVARRQAQQAQQQDTNGKRIRSKKSSSSSFAHASANATTAIGHDFAGNPLDEVVEIIALPDLYHGDEEDPNTIELDPEIIVAIRSYVSCLASMYRDNVSTPTLYRTEEANCLTC